MSSSAELDDLCLWFANERDAPPVKQQPYMDVQSWQLLLQLLSGERHLVSPMKHRRRSCHLRPRLGQDWVRSQVEAILECGAMPELTSEDRAWDSMPAVGAERFWEPAQARLSLKKRLALKQLMGKRRARRP